MFLLKVKPNLSAKRARTYVVRPAEGRQKAVQGSPVRDVDSGALKADLVLIAVEKTVMTHGKIENLAWGDAGGVMIGVVGSGRRDRHSHRSVLRY
jgi:hypothetical protein